MNAIDQDRDQMLFELDERTRESWTRYSERLRELTGREYDDAERDSWTLLQAELHEIAEERAGLLAPA